MNRITNATYQGALEESFVYDAAGNRTSHTDIDGDTVGYTVDATGQLVSDTAGTTYSYDAAGNLTATSAGEAYVYDDFGRATEITIEGVTEQYTYDAQDVRVTVDGTTQLWDRNGLPTLISTGAGDNYVHAAGIARDGDDWLLQDAVGSVRATVDQAGVVSAETAFTAYGEPLTGQVDSFGFAGEQLDTTGLLHLRARQYNPTVGRFTTVDPVQPGAPGTTGYNLYTYAANNPTTFTDPSGQAVLAEHAALIGDQADATEVFASGVGNCANASFSRATAGLEGFDIGEDPGQAVLRDCRNGAIDAAATGAVFSAGGRIVGEGLEAGARLAGDFRPAARAADQVGTGRQALPVGTNPVAIGTAGNPGALDSTAPTRFSVDSSGQATDLTGFSTNPDTINQSLPPTLPTIPVDARVRILTPSTTGGAQNGVEFIFPNADGVTTRIRIHGPDPSAPAGSNAATGDVLRVQIGGSQVDVDGNRFPRGVFNPNSPNFSDTIANDLHIPWPPR